jgi:hypothetical protein
VGQNYAQKQGFNLTKLEYLITAQNVDGTKTNKELSDITLIQIYMSMARNTQNDSLLLDWETKKSFWDYLGCKSITQRLTGKKEHYTGEL